MEKFKAWISLLFLILICKIGGAQVLKFRAFEYFSGDISKGPKILDWDNANYLVVVNYYKNKVDIYSPEIVSIDFVDSGSYKTDSIGALLTHQGVDQNGEKCTIVQRQFNDISDTEVERIIVYYSKNRSLIYRLKKNE